MSGKNTKANEATAATENNGVVNNSINLADFVSAKSANSSSSEKSSAGSNRDASAYSMLKSEKMQVKVALENGVRVTPIKNYRFINGVFLLSDNKIINSKDMSVDVLSKLADGTNTSEEVIVFKGEVDTATEIYNLFMNKDTAPSTKCHGKWFGIDANNNPVFVALQGDSIKVCK